MGRNEARWEGFWMFHLDQNPAQDMTENFLLQDISKHNNEWFCRSLIRLRVCPNSAENGDILDMKKIVSYFRT